MTTRSRLLSVVALGLCAALCASSLAQFTQVVRYDEHRVVRAQIGSKQQLDLLLALTGDVWSHGVGIGPVDVRVTPQQFEALQKTDIQFDVMIEDVQALIEQNRAAGGIAGDPYSDYMPLSGVYAYIDTLIAQRPDLATKTVIGQSLEGRDIIMMTITGSNPGPKPGVFYQSCQHAREWVTIPALLYFAEQLLTNYDSDPDVHELVDRAEFYLVFVVNPDGYEYTWTSQRLWRKNRRDNAGSCDGVDLNRNWDSGYATGGSSNDPCDETYHGTGPFSEPETTVIRDAILARPNIVTFNDIHSYSQLVLLPFGYTGQLPANQDDYVAVGNAMAQLIAGVHGVNYAVGNIFHILYQASGDSGDWAHEVAGAFAIGFELRDTGFFGFELPPSQILPNAEEIYPALFYQADWATPLLRIEFPNGTPTNVEPAGGTTMAVDIVNAFDTADPGTATLHVRTSAGGAFTQVPMADLGGGQYEATFPALPCDPQAEFYVTVDSLEGHSFQSPDDAPATLHSAPIGTLTVVIADDFETDTGWTVVNENLTAGAWERGVPAGAGDRGDPLTDYDGSGQCWLTDNVAGNSDVDGGPTRLVSPVFDLSDLQDYVISYARWFTNDDNDADRLVVEVTNDGAIWFEVESVANGAGWSTNSFRLLDYLAPTATVQVRFSATDNPNDSVTEAAIDAFSITSLSCDTGAAPVDVPLNSVNVSTGTLVSGGVAELDASDDSYVVVDPELVAANKHVTDVTVRGFSPVTAVSRLDVRVETGTNRTKVATKIYLNDRDANSWVQLDKFLQPQVDTVSEFLDVANPNAYVRDSDGLVRVRIFSRRGAVNPHQYRIDEVQMTVTP